ncbi:MAG: C40 family peptidase [Gammaproteobacteria bacterium]
MHAERILPATSFRLPCAVVLGAALLMLAACSTGLRLVQDTPTKTAQQRADIIAIAQQMIGAPYRPGGTTPRGFDCSGLVLYTYRQAGIVNLSRTTAGLFQQTQPVTLDDMLPGDLLFFEISGHGVSHVGIYQGDNEFIHAPVSGKQVSVGTLDNGYWSKRLVRAGRLL